MTATFFLFIFRKEVKRCCRRKAARTRQVLHTADPGEVGTSSRGDGRKKFITTARGGLVVALTKKKSLVRGKGKGGSDLAGRGAKKPKGVEVPRVFKP